MIIPEHGGKFPSDFSLKNEDNNKIELLIEHENSKRRILYNYKKLIKNKTAKERLLICYLYDKDNIKEKILELKTYKRKHKIKKTIHLLIAKKGKRIFFTKSKDYVYDSI